MKGYDAFAGVIKSGGKTRRAAKMVILNVDHPDIMEFIKSKAQEEKKAWALIQAGYDGNFDGEAAGVVGDDDLGRFAELDALSADGGCYHRQPAGHRFENLESRSRTGAQRRNKDPVSAVQRCDLVDLSDDVDSVFAVPLGDDLRWAGTGNGQSCSRVTTPYRGPDLGHQELESV